MEARESPLYIKLYISYRIGGNYLEERWSFSLDLTLALAAYQMNLLYNF